MNRFEEVAVGLYLSYWPEDWSFHQILEKLYSENDENDENKITICEFYQDYWPELIANEIKYTHNVLVRNFDIKNSVDL